MKTVMLLTCGLLLGGCFSSKVLVRPLDEAIVDAATKAKAAGAKELTLEMSVISALKGTTNIPISVVTFGVESSKSTSSKVIVKIPDLGQWKNPNEGISGSDQAPSLFLLDKSTYQLKSIKPSLE